MKKYLLAAGIALLGTLGAFGQYNYADVLVSSGPCSPIGASCPNGTAVTNPGFAIDADRDNYAILQSVGAPLDSAFVVGAFTPAGNSGMYVGAVISMNTDALDNDLLGSIVLEIKDATGNVWDRRRNFTTADLTLVPGHTDRFIIGFYTTPISFPLARVELRLGPGVSNFNDLRLHSFYNAVSCATENANAVFATNVVCTVPLGCNNALTNPGNAADGNSLTYANMFMDAAGNIDLDLSFANPGNTNDYVGFEISNATPATYTDFPNGITFNLYNVGGVPEQSTPATDASVLVFPSGVPGNFVYLVPATASTVINRAEIVLTRTSFDPLPAQVDVARMFHYDREDLPLGNTPSGPIEFCSGSSVTMTGDAGFSTYLWYHGPSTQNVILTAPGDFGYRGVDATGCVGVSAPVTTDTFALPTFDVVSTGDSILCGGDTEQLYTSVQGYTSYLWSTGDSTDTITISTGGTYSVTVTDSNGCQSSDDISIFNGTLVITGTTTATTCGDSQDGAIDVTVTGGSSTYSYFWNNGATTEDLTNVQSGLYNIFVTDVNTGCRARELFGVNPGVTLSLATININPDCGANNGAIDLLVSGGSAGKIYTWTNGAGTEDLVNIAGGNYGVTVTDGASGCTASKLISLNSKQQMVVSEGITKPQCNGANGAINLTVSGGSGSYSFLWSNGSTTQNISGLSAGTYYVDVMDNNTGCVSARAYIVDENNNLSIVPTITDATCKLADGSIDITVSGGSTNLSYNWSNGATTEDIMNVSSGFYTLTLTDNITGCQRVKQYLVNEMGDPTITASVMDVSCNFGNDGYINTTVTGGSGAYDFVWTNGATTQSVSNLIAGDYTLLVRDTVFGCVTFATYTVTEPNPIDIESTFIGHVSCAGGNDGSISITAVGGTSPYSFIWSHGPTTQNVNGLVANSYGVTVTDANGCTQTASYTITEPTPIMISGTSQDAGCIGDSIGSIDITVSGGTPGYTYNWSNGETTQDISNLGAGTYTVTVTDSNNCTITGSYVVSESLSTIKIAANVFDATCKSFSDGFIDITPSGGTGYTFEWSTGEVSEDIHNLIAGFYTVTVTDTSNTCFGTRGFSVFNDDLVITKNIVNATCDKSDGEISINVIGGSGSYNYFWNPSLSNSPLQTGLPSGAYEVIVRDSLNGCADSIVAAVSDLGGATVSGFVSNVTACNKSDGQISLNVSGGSGSYSFNWSNGATTQNINGLLPGDYSVEVIDDSTSCKTYKTFIVGFANTLVVTSNAFDANCGQSDGTINSIVTGGSGNYSYQWSNGATTQNISNIPGGIYTLTVIDISQTACSTVHVATIGEVGGPSLGVAKFDISCAGADDGKIDITVTSGSGLYTFEWTNNWFQEDQDFLLAGQYIITVTDTVSGCFASRSVTINEPKPIHLTATATDLLCAGSGQGSIDIDLEGGVPPYNYTWSNGSFTQDLTNINGGNYTLTLMDFTSCRRTMNVNVFEPLPLTGVMNITDATCSENGDAEIEVIASGGVAPYRYSINNDPFVQSNIFTDLFSGIYRIRVIDTNGCIFTDTNVVVGNGTLTISRAVTPVACPGDNTGAVNISISGGSGAYVYQWSNGAITQDIVNAGVGNYTVNVMDTITGCSTNQAFTINPSNCVEVAFIVYDPNCGESNGQIVTKITGGFNGNFTYQWSTGDITPVLKNVKSGRYTLTVIDNATNCKSISVVEVDDIEGPKATAEIVNAACGAGGGEIKLTTTEGVEPYTYLWSNGFTTKDITGLASGKFGVTIHDDLGCRSHAFFNVGTANVMTLNPKISRSNCGRADGSIVLDVKNGSNVYNYFWSNGANSAVNSGLKPGIYSVTVLDANSGCTVSKTYTISDSAVHQLNIQSYIQPLCAGAKDGEIQVLGTGGSNSFQYNWSHGQNTRLVTGLNEGTYYLEVVDNFTGCKTIHTYEMDRTDPYYVALDRWDVSCDADGQVPGAVDLRVRGGAGNYDYNWSNGVFVQDQPALDGDYYTVRITDKNGCAIDAGLEIVDFDCPNLRVPNGFSPNGDGINDTWVIPTIEYFPNSLVKVFNRYGNLVFEATGYQNEWRGKYLSTDNDLPDGTYYFVVNLNDGKTEAQTGFVVIHR